MRQQLARFIFILCLVSHVLWPQPSSQATPHRTEAAKPKPDQSINGQQNEKTGTAEIKHAKGGLLEKPSAARVQAFKAAAARALNEYRQKLNFALPRTQEQQATAGVAGVKRGAAARPASAGDPVFSWRSVIKFNTNEDQGTTCGSCYIFAGVGALETSWAKQHVGQNIAASQQLVLNCVGSCSGGYVSTVLQFLTDKGTSAYATDPYLGVPAGCSFNLPLPYQTVAGAYVANDGRMPSEQDLKAAILQYGPIPAFMYAGGSFDTWNMKEPAIITDDSSGANNGHIVLIVGWNDNPGVNAWEIKNSWGQNWGDQGFALVRKGVRDLGDNAMWFVAVP